MKLPIGPLWSNTVACMSCVGHIACLNEVEETMVERNSKGFCSTRDHLIQAICCDVMTGPLRCSYSALTRPVEPELKFLAPVRGI